MDGVANGSKNNEDTIPSSSTPGDENDECTTGTPNKDTAIHDDHATLKALSTARGANMADKDIRDLEDWYDWVNGSANKPAHALAKAFPAVRKYLQTPESFGKFMAVLLYKHLKTLADSKRKEKVVDGILTHFVDDTQKAVAKEKTTFYNA